MVTDYVDHSLLWKINYKKKGRNMKMKAGFLKRKKHVALRGK